MRSDEDIFCENSTYLNGASIKKRLYKMGVKEECTGCGLGPEWRGLPLTLQLEHINGVHNDNRLENLAILCPNCHSQTSTFAGKNIKVKTPPNLCQCGSQILKNSIRCNSCSASERESNTYPSTEELIAGVKARGFSAVGREIGVSDVAVRKHLKKVLGEEDLLFRR
jgi:Zn finger protein HypA/HybF involved in hydrogenase expression